MQHHRFFVWLRTGIVAFVLLALMPAQSMLAAQSSGNSFESSIGYTVTWDDNWEFDDTLIFEAEGSFDIITLWNESSGFVMISGVVGSVGDPAPPLKSDSDEEVISSDLEGEVPQLITDDGNFRTIEESYAVDDGAISVTVALTTTPLHFDSVLATAQEGVQVNGSPVLTGEPLADSGAAPDLTETATTPETTDSGVTRTTRGGSTDETSEATEEAGSGVTRTTRGSTDETPESTEEASSGVTRTTRGSTEETPEATEGADSGVTRTTRGSTDETPEPTEEASGRVTSGLETFVGPVYDYTFQYDDEIWEVRETLEDETSDGLSMTSSTSTLTIWAWDGYGNDPLACLDGEAEFYANESDSITDWTEVTDANGDPVRGESNEIAWGVYSLLYENDRGNQTELVDYISCQPIPGQDAVVIVLLSSAPENYNSNLDLTFDILDTMQFADQGTSPDPQPTKAAVVSDSGDQDNRTQIDTNFDGSQYTSPTYGFTVYVPLEWQIETESVDGDDETLVLNNGTSVVTLWATPAPAGDLSACVDYAAESSGLNLQLLENSTGGDFRGTYGDEAFGNFVYTDGDVQMMYFIGCQPIPDSDAVLILTQDVPFDQFTSERRFRNEIEESLTMP